MYDVITLITDFGSYYPGVMKCSLVSALRCLNHRAEVIDVSHDVEPFNVMQGAFLLLNSWRYAKAVHCVVVDPTVGGDRRAIAVLCEKSAFVGPDNGVLYPAAAEAGIERIVAVDCKKVFDFLKGCLRRDVKLSNTFHGRDVFAPLSAMVACGKLDEVVKEELEEMVRLDVFDVKVRDNTVHCRVIFNDRFGNAVTNLKGELLRGIKAVKVSGTVFPLVERIPDVRVGEPFAIIGSFGTLELCVREGSAKDMGLKAGELKVELI